MRLRAWNFGAILWSQLSYSAVEWVQVEQLTSLGIQVGIWWHVNASGCDTGDSPYLKQLKKDNRLTREKKEDQMLSFKKVMPCCAWDVQEVLIHLCDVYLLTGVCFDNKCDFDCMHRLEKNIIRPGKQTLNFSHAVHSANPKCKSRYRMLACDCWSRLCHFVVSIGRLGYLILADSAWEN